MINFTNTFTDQDGMVWDMAHGNCPRCTAPSNLKHRAVLTGYFTCPSCDLLYDEPSWSGDEAFVTCISDEDARDDPDPEIRRRWAQYRGVWPYEG